MEYQIGEFSHISRLSVKTLRFYHDEGILIPSRIDDFTGYRYYDEAAADRARVIRDLRDLGFSIRDIREIITDCSDDEEILPYLTRKQGEIQRKIAEYTSMERKLRQMIELQEEIMKLNVQNDVIIKDIPDMRVAFLRYTGRYDEIGKYLGTLFRYAGRYAAGKPFAQYYDQEYREEGAEGEVCLPVRREVNEREVRSRLLKGGKALSLIHRGPYEKLGDSYRRLYDALGETGAELQIPIRESYLKGPGMILPGNPKKYLTELQFFISRK